MSAVIAVFGTAVTALGANYTVINRRAGAAHQVAILNARLNADLDTMKAQSSEALERLKAGLDLTKAAYRELFGAATTLLPSADPETSGSRTEVRSTLCWREMDSNFQYAGAASRCSVRPFGGAAS